LLAAPQGAAFTSFNPDAGVHLTSPAKNFSRNIEVIHLFKENNNFQAILRIRVTV
jgi:hypothetical protein